MMQDCKALQAGTSHFLGQNFARASNIRFQTEKEAEDYAWTTSWGTSTRMIGGLIMTHGDDDGVVMPPRVAPAHVVLLPIYRKPEERREVMAYVDALAAALRGITYVGRDLVVEVDDRDIGGARGWDWIKKGIPVRVEIGPRDIAGDSVFVARRDRAHRDKTAMGRQAFIAGLPAMLDDIQSRRFERARRFREAHTRHVDDRQTFYDWFTPKNAEKPEIHGGFAMSPWCGQAACESTIKEDLNVTIRCIPLDAPKEAGSCICCGRPADQRVVFAKAY
ncbi:MAG TPA: His/Gly/Thr/Pro-type tRNA ligase C-terminal domain-containing protein, partial [Desulfosarcina sp.]|nr:His/Gly/Thr/Pro-type tRNA ligase C-terminal domain-containing protein [Desulfosarcina sp.]